MNSTLEAIRTRATAAWNDYIHNGRPKVTVVLDTSSLARGAAATLDAIKAEVAARGLGVDVAVAGSWGFNWLEPTLTVRSAAGTRTVLYGNVTAERAPELVQATLIDGRDLPELAIGVVEGSATAEIPLLSDHPYMQGQVRRLMERMGIIDPEKIDHYLAVGGYEGLSKALDLSPEAIIKEMLDSGVGGRGGANFPVGRKWDFLRTATAEPRYLVCNADEGDPGAWVNRTVMEGDPHLIIEGLLIAARATGASEAYIYVRHEYPLAFDRMKTAAAQAREKGLLGKDILGLGWDFEIVVFLGAGSYVCGDETGLMSSIDSYRGMPRIKPPFPAQAGLWNKPTNVNNVESYANAPLILRHGAAWWCNLAPADQPEKGTKMYSLSGQIRQMGVVEIPFGSGTMRSMLEQYGGGMQKGSTLKGFQPGGPLSGVLPAADADLPLKLAPYRERGMFLGGGGLMFFDESTSIVDLVLWMTTFCEDESCGRCTTCHGGSQRAVEILRRIADGGGRETDLDKLEGIVQTLIWSNCQHGQLTPTAIKLALRAFRDELLSVIRDKVDPSHSLPGFIEYVVKNPADAALKEAVAICPTGAFSGEGASTAIEQDRCIKCGACKEVAPGAIEKRDRVIVYDAVEAAGA